MGVDEKGDFKELEFLSRFFYLNNTFERSQKATIFSWEDINKQLLVQRLEADSGENC